MERILLVEDDKNLSFITKRLLESRGYEVTAAMSLTEARGVLLQKRLRCLPVTVRRAQFTEKREKDLPRRDSL